MLKFRPNESMMQVQRVLTKNPEYEYMGSLIDDDGMNVSILLKKPAAMRLAGGTYFISATMLQPVTSSPLLDNAFGPWNQRYEDNYQYLYNQVKPFLDDNEDGRMAALHTNALMQWRQIFYAFEMWRFARLTAYLRQREPDDNVDFSILVYHLTDEDIKKALDGPPAELKPDTLEKRRVPADVW